jgi:PmbA protein
VSALYGENIQQERSFLADKIGKKVGSKLFNLIDDPFIEGGLGSRLYDRDGFAAKKRSIVKEGILKDFYIDWYYSLKLDEEPTTGNPSNLVLPPGKQTVKDIMKNLGKGILINEFIGGSANSTTGDFSIGITGQLFDDGKTVHAVSEMNIADNHLEFWDKLIEVANDPWIYSKWRVPSLVFKDIVVSGV